MKKPVILITMGDPSGIGPEIILKAYKNQNFNNFCTPVVVGNKSVLEQTAVKMDIKAEFKLCQIDNIPQKDNKILLIESGLDIDSFKYGTPGADTGELVFSYITDSIKYCMLNKADGIATAPINKLTLKESGIDFNGHTEILAHYSDTKEYAMMMYGDILKVVLVTIHVPLSIVNKSITKDKIYNKIKLTHSSLKERFSIKDPKIAVCGLNPHAGEEGLFGNEDIDIILPAIEKAKSEGINAIGPLPPDTVFFNAKKGEFDCVLCMYHDQGLIPFKLLHFEDGVNTTLGLPFPRTSVDHGTAYDIAGKNQADPKSLIEAVKLAAFQAKNVTNK